MRAGNEINERYHRGSKIQTKIISARNFTYRILLLTIEKYLKPNSNVIDLGCGVGTLDFYIASRNCSVVGIDVSKNAIKKAKESAQVLGLQKKMEFVAEEAETYKSIKKYDLILMTEIIEHVVDDNKLLIRFHRLLNNGGILILSTRSSNAPLFKLGLSKFHDVRVGHLRRYSAANLGKIFKTAKYKIIESLATEGILRDFLFSFPFVGGPIIRIANKSIIFANLLTFLDDILLRFLGESQIIIVASN